MFALLLAGALIVIFFLMIAPYFEALVLAAVFAGLLYPVHKQIARRVGLESIAAAIATTALALLVIVLPLTGLIGVLAREAVRVSEVVAPLVDGKNDVRNLSRVLPRRLPYRGQILERANDAIKQTGTFVVERLTPPEQAYFDGAWKRAVSDRLVDVDHSADYGFQLQLPTTIYEASR